MLSFLLSLSLSLSLSLTHTHTHTHTRHTPHDNPVALSATRHMASANTCPCISFIKKKWYFHTQKKPPGPLLLFFFPKTNTGPSPATQPWLLSHSNAASFPRGRGAPPPMPLGSCASWAVRGARGGGHFFNEGLCVRARRAVCADAAWRTRVTRRGARGTRNKVTPGSSVRVAFGSSCRRVAIKPIVSRERRPSLGPERRRRPRRRPALGSVPVRHAHFGLGAGASSSGV